MIILHASAEEGRLLLWGESPAEVGPRRRKRKSSQPEPFPFDPGADRFAAVLAGTLRDPSESSLEAEARFLWLPAVKERPVPSSALTAELPDPDATATLLPWSTTVFRLSSAQTIDLLCVCVDRETLSPGVIV